ncbi:MAG: bacillithiol system redox-active protein YtxJ [Bacteroidia bacterium]|nr:bacillithiol system redox-active protein YtxJ [Bacteroidia bacterium]
MNWKRLTGTEQLNQLEEESRVKRVLIFKHSTRCSISDAALGRLQRHWKEENEEQITCYYLDLLKFRELSNHVAEKYGVPHQSPQALLIRDGKCVFSQTHFDIDLKQLLNA